MFKNIIIIYLCVIITVMLTCNIFIISRDYEVKPLPCRWTGHRHYNKDNNMYVLECFKINRFVNRSSYSLANSSFVSDIYYERCNKTNIVDITPNKCDNHELYNINIQIVLYGLLGFPFLYVIYEYIIRCIKKKSEQSLYIQNI